MSLLHACGVIVHSPSRGGSPPHRRRRAALRRMRELMKKYDKVALSVYLLISAASITGLYVAINNNVDVEAIFRKVKIFSSVGDSPDAGEATREAPERRRNWTAKLTVSSGGALALAMLCNKVLFLVRVPVTIALTPPIARFLVHQKLVKT